MIQVGHVLCWVQHMWVQVDRVVVCDTIGGAWSAICPGCTQSEDVVLPAVVVSAL